MERPRRPRALLLALALLLPAALAGAQPLVLEDPEEPAEELMEPVEEASEEAVGEPASEEAVNGAAEAGGNATAAAPGFVHHASPRFAKALAPLCGRLNNACYAAGETSIGVNPRTGAVMFQQLETTARVTFDDSVSPPRASWRDVTFLPAGLATLDPILWTDPATGRTFVAQLSGDCSDGALTDDDGDVWLPMALPCAAPSYDHQTVGGGPYAIVPSPPNVVYTNALYYCAQSTLKLGTPVRGGFSECARSDDGGLTWGPPTPMNRFVCQGLHGHVAVAPDGALYVPHKDCFGKQGLLRSLDDGLTWTLQGINGTVPWHSDPKVAFDAAGRMYVAMSSAGKMVVTTSTTRGATFTVPLNIGANLGINNTEFPMVVAGDAGRAAVAFYGSTKLGDDQSSSYTGVWHLFVGFTSDGGATWQTTDITPTDPVQRGCIWLQGGSNACRNLLDFQDMALDARGYVVVGYADGCTSTKCIGPTGIPSDSRDSLGVIARQVAGQPLLGGPRPAQAPLVSVSAPTSTVLGQPVELLALGLGGEPPYDFAWDLDGDGAFDDAAGQVASLAADRAGTQRLAVRMTDSSGAGATGAAAVRVGDPEREVLARAWDFGGCAAQGWSGVQGPGAQGWRLAALDDGCAWTHVAEGAERYPALQEAWLLSPGEDCLDLPASATGARLEFRVLGALEEGWDELLVEAGPCGSGNLGALEGLTGTQGDPGAGTWGTRSVDLGDWIGRGPVQLAFHVRTDPSVEDRGYLLSHLRLYVQDRAPALEPVGDQRFYDTEPLALQLRAADPDGDAVRFHAAGLPEGASLDGAGLLTWQPTGAQNGVYRVRLEATDGILASGESVVLTVLNAPPVARGASDALVTDRLTDVRFADASADADGTVRAWRWDFGDGAASSTANPTHRFAALGAFTPNLVVTDDDGDAGRAALPAITVVNLPPDAAFARTPGEANRVDAVQFTDASSDRDGHVAAWRWDFGDGSGSTGQHPAHTYSRLGTFPVALAVEDGDGGFAVASGSVTVMNLAPRAGFATTPEHPLAFAPTVFEDRSIDRDGHVAAWRWDFGDGAQSTDQGPAHVYLHGGWYHVTLGVVDDEGGEATLARDIAVCAPGGELTAGLDAGHLRAGLDACVRVDGGELPL
jgi:PKD repeat protein